MKKQLIILLAVMSIMCAGSFFSLLPAQEGRGRGRVTGFVKDEETKPIEGVKVTIEYIKFNYKLEARTDADGKFIFIGLGTGTVKVWAQKDGYARSGIGLHVSGINKAALKPLILKKHQVVMQDASAKDDKYSGLKGQFKKAEAFFNERQFEAALAIYQDSRKKRPDLYKINLNIAYCYLGMNRFDEAIGEFERVLEKMPAEAPDTSGNKEIAQIYSGIGNAYMRQDKLKPAEVYFKKSIAIAVDDYTPAYNAAEILFAVGKSDEAIQYYDLAIKINPKWTKSYVQRGYAYLDKGDTPKAIASFKQFLELDPDSPDANGVRQLIDALK